jgi:hypothetical protein
LRFDDAERTYRNRAPGVRDWAETTLRRRRLIFWRIIGWLLLLAGAAVLARDLVAYFDQHLWAPLVLGQLWYELDRSSLNLAQAVIQRYVSPFLWDRIVVAVLLCWAWAVLLGLGGVMLVLGRRRRRSGLEAGCARR